MSRSRYVRWSDSALLFVLKARDMGWTTKQIAQEVNRGEPAVIELLRRYDAEQPPAKSPDRAQVSPQSRGKDGENKRRVRMSEFDEYNRRWQGRSYSENVRRFAGQHGISEHDVDDMQAAERSRRNQRLDEIDGFTRSGSCPP